MYTQNSINPLQSVTLRNNVADFNRNKETFHDIFQRKLNNKSNSRPPKIELTGVLKPVGRESLPFSCKYKLATDSKEYLLGMSDETQKVAKKMEWEEVTVKGYLDFDADVFEVEKMSLSRNYDPIEIATVPDIYFELESYKKTMSQREKLDLAVNELFS